MSFSTRPARLRGPIALAAAAGLAALLVAPAAGVAQDQPAPRQQPRRPAAPAAQPAPAPGACDPGSAGLAGSARRCGSAADRADGRPGQARAVAARLDEGLRQGPVEQQRDLLHDPRLRVGPGPAGDGGRGLRGQERAAGRADAARRALPAAARPDAPARHPLRDRPGPADARPLRALLPERLLRRGGQAQGRLRRPDEEGHEPERQRPEPGRARGHLLGAARRLRQGLRRRGDRPEGARGAAEEAAGGARAPRRRDAQEARAVERRPAPRPPRQPRRSSSRVGSPKATKSRASRPAFCCRSAACGRQFAACIRIR